MIKFKKIVQDAIIPKRQQEGDGGFDLHCLDDLTLYNGDQACFKTGIACAIPKGFVGVVRPRSGLAVKHSIDTRAGVIDSSYRGELLVVLRNDGIRPYEFKQGDRIAQMIVVPYMGDSMEVDDLDETERGECRFGSSGR